MSIAGVWANTPNVAASRLELLLAALPSGAGVAPRRVQPSYDVAFAYLPTVRAAESWSEPLQDEMGALTITGDVRIDNREELIATLKPRDEALTDNALVLLAYERWQGDCAAHLLGDFTFVLYDSPRKRLFAARDVAGSRAFYYAIFAGQFAFASNPGALRALPGLPLELDARAVVDYLGDFPEDEQSTLIRAVRRLPPGAQLTYGGSGLKVAHYFRLDAIPEQRLANDDEYAEALRAELRRAVTCRLPKRARVGVMLSGGLDSSMVTALAAQQSARRVSTFSAVFDNIPECDERIYQGPVVRASRTEHHEVRPEPRGAGADFATLARTFGEPAPMGPHWLSWAAAEAAVSEGISVLLTGADGDRVVSHGTGRTAELAFQHRWLELAREVRAVRDFSRMRAARVFAVHAALPFVPESWRLFLERHDPRRRQLLTTALSVLRPEAVRAAGVLPRLQLAMRRPLNTRDSHEQILTSSNRGRDVELLDRLGAQLGLEFRHPFFDRRVIELCLGFPGEQKRQRGRPRYVLRNAMAGLVPDEVRLRPTDTYFNAAFAAWNRPWGLAQAAAPLNLDNLEPFVNVRALHPLQERLSSRLGETALGPVDVARRCVLLSKWLDSIGASK